MKQLILILLLSYNFCISESINHLEKYDSIKMTSEIGIVYLDIEEFKEGDTIHMLFDAINGYMGSTLYYEFSDEEPTDINQKFIHSTQPSLTSSTEVQTMTDHTITQSYYYDIEKAENTKYFVMKYNNFVGEYLEVENNRANWGKVLLICIFGGIGLIALIILGIYIFYRIMQKRRSRRNVLDYNQNQPTEQTGTPYQQNPQNTYNTNTNTDEAFYEPPPPPGLV